MIIKQIAVHDKCDHFLSHFRDGNREGWDWILSPPTPFSLRGVDFSLPHKEPIKNSLPTEPCSFF